MIINGKTEDKLTASLRHVLGKQNLDKQRLQIQKTAAELNIGLLDCAAALLFLRQAKYQAAGGKITDKPAPAPGKLPNRNVRYRLDVGSQHQVNREEIQALLISESGVDKKRIGKIDIRPDHTIVELPDGMPSDIFQLLSEASLGNRKLALKRIKGKKNRRPNPATKRITLNVSYLERPSAR